MVFDWEKYITENIDVYLLDFIKVVVYCESSEVTKATIIQELELLLLFKKENLEAYTNSLDEYALKDYNIVRDIDETQIYLQELEQYLQSYKEDMFPILKNERERILYLQPEYNHFWDSSEERIDKKQDLRSSIKSILSYHEEKKIIAPKSLINYVDSLKSKQTIVDKQNNKKEDWENNIEKLKDISKDEYKYLYCYFAKDVLNNKRVNELENMFHKSSTTISDYRKKGKELMQKLLGM